MQTQIITNQNKQNMSIVIIARILVVKHVPFFYVGNAARTKFGMSKKNVKVYVNLKIAILIVVSDIFILIYILRSRFKI
jgi:hypothetical protein